MYMSKMSAKEKEGNYTKKVWVSFTEEQWKVIEKLKGLFGSTDSEVVRNIVLAWLAEKSIISSMVKEYLKEIDT